jgi:hypothetical protein
VEEPPPIAAFKPKPKKTETPQAINCKTRIGVAKSCRNVY